MGVYVSVCPFRWAWDFTIKDAQLKSLHGFSKKAYFKIPMKLYQLHNDNLTEIAVLVKQWKLGRDTVYLGDYYAVPDSSGDWEIIKTR